MRTSVIATLRARHRTCFTGERGSHAARAFAVAIAIAIADRDSDREDRAHAGSNGTDHLECNTVSAHRRLHVLADERHR